VAALEFCILCCFSDQYIACKGTVRVSEQVSSSN
jgi:hypothetical protein